MEKGFLVIHTLVLGRYVETLGSLILVLNELDRAVMQSDYLLCRLKPL